MAVTSSAISSSPLFHQSPPSSISSSCYSSVSPLSLKPVTAHQGSSSTSSSRLSVSASSESSSSLPASRRKSLSTSGDNATPRSSSSSVIDFLTLCHRLKTTKRKGWVNHGIQSPESIADHMYLMAIMALIASDITGIDRERCIKIAIVHDIAEAIVGDITPSDGIPKAEKRRRESEALAYMCEVLGEKTRADEVRELWAEYENNSSTEAKLVKDFDKVEMILQALEYESEHGKVLDEFFLSTAGKFQTDVGKRWAAEVTSRRNRRLSE